MKTLYKYLTLIVVLAVCGIIAYFYFAPSGSRVTLHDATIKEVKDMARLCTVEIYEEVPVRGHVGRRHLVAREVLVGNISFDLEGLAMDASSDTIRVTLPREIVEIRESTEPGSYTVIDNWNDSFMGNPNITTEEENKMKKLTLDSFVKAVYAKGYVKRARAEAVANLTSLLSSMTGKPVVVTDPSPEGYQGK